MVGGAKRTGKQTAAGGSFAVCFPAFSRISFSMVLLATADIQICFIDDVLAQAYCSLTDVLLGKVAGTLSCKLGIVTCISTQIGTGFPSSSLGVIQSAPGLLYTCFGSE